MNPAGTLERKVILRQIYRMSESEFRKYVLQYAFTGRQSPPREVTMGDTKKFAAKHRPVLVVQ
jgi:hypothetical protein